MADYRWKRRVCLMVLLLAVCGGMTCWIKLGQTADALELKSTTQITKVSFRETFGQAFEVEIIATEEELLYRCSKQDILGITEPEIITRNFSFGQETWRDLVSVYSDNLVYYWKDQEYYLNQCYGQESGLFVEYPDVKFVEAGSFFNIAGSTPDFEHASPPRYYGIDQNEKNFRGDYSSHVAVYINDGERLYILWSAGRIRRIS